MRPPTPIGPVLLVDDDDCFRRAMAIALKLEGVEVYEARDGREALRLAHERPFALALVDLLLGNESGDEILAAIAAASPKTLLAATSDLGLPSRLAARGLALQLDKPLLARDLLAVLRERPRPAFALATAARAL